MPSSLLRTFLAAFFFLVGQELVTASEARADGPFTIRSQLDGRCLDADGNVPPNTPGARVQTWRCNGSIQQKWYIELMPGLAVRYRNAYSNTCLDFVDPRNLRNGSPVYLWPCHEGSAQAWLSEPDSNLQFATLFVSANAQFALDYDLNTQGDGGTLQIWRAGNMPQQQVWIRYPANLSATETWAASCHCSDPNEEVFKELCLSGGRLDIRGDLASMCKGHCQSIITGRSPADIRRAGTPNFRNPSIRYVRNEHRECTQTDENRSF